MPLINTLKKNAVILALSLLSVFSFVALTQTGYFPMHDDMQVMRLYEMEQCFADGQIPCRWVPDQGDGYGYPQFNFYSPLPYYVMYFFRWLGFGYLAAVKTGFILSLLLSVLTMFSLGSWLWGNLGGAVSALLYLFAPYRAMDIYNRGAMAEAWAFVFLPLVFLGIGRWVKENHGRDLLLVSFGLAGLFLSHNITTLIFAPFGLIWALLWLVKEKRFRPVRGLFSGGVLGLGLAAFFVLPAFVEKKFVHVETMLMGYFNYLAHFVSLPQLLFGTRWGYGSSILGPNEQVNFSVGVFHWLFALSGLAGAWFFFRGRQERGKKWLGLFLGLSFLTSVFFTHQISIFFWQKVPFLKWLQFPWRFLVLAVFFESILAGLVFSFVSPRRNRLLLAGLVVGLVLFVNVGYFRPRSWFPLTDEEKLSGELWREQQKISIFDYLPVWAKQPPGSPAPDQPWAVRGEVEVLEFEKGTDWQRGEVRVFSESARLRLPLYHFPGMHLEVDGRPVAHSFDNELGLITFSLPAGRHSFLVKLTDTWPRTTGNVISLLSGAVLGLLIIYPSWRRRLRCFFV